MTKDNIQLHENNFNLKSIIEKMFEQIEELKEENKEIRNENKEIKEENRKIKEENSKIIEKNNEIELRLKKIEINNQNQIIKKNNFHWINREVNIIKHSNFDSTYVPEIMLGKEESQRYSLTQGNRNHFIEFSFKKMYFLKSIRIKVDNFECSLKTFTVEIIDQNGNSDNIGSFIRSKYQDNSNFQDFEINKECKGIKLNLIDNWGSGGGNFILISKIDFYVSD